MIEMRISGVCAGKDREAYGFQTRFAKATASEIVSHIDNANPALFITRQTLPA